MMKQDPRARGARRRLTRGLAAALAALGLAAAVAGTAASAHATPAADTASELRIGANHNQVLV